MLKDYSLTNLLPSHGELYYLKDFLEHPDDLMESVLREISWRDDKITMFGKQMSQPRKVAWYGEKDICYTYSGIKMFANYWSPTLKLLQLQLSKQTGHTFNSVLVNLYRNGEDYMSWHSDDEAELGSNPVIASLSLGASRDILFRSKSDRSNKLKLQLENGSLLLMQGEIQTYWQHMLPKRKRVQGARLNLTFRKINC